MQLLPACVVFIISLGTVGGACSDPEEEQEADELEADAGERLQLISCDSLPIVLMVSLGRAATLPPAIPAPAPAPALAAVSVAVAPLPPVAALVGLLQLLVDSPPPPPPPPASGILIISLGTTLLTRSSLAARIVSLGTMCGNCCCCWRCSSSAHEDDEQDEDASELTAATSCGGFNDLIVSLGTKPSCDCC